MTKHPQVVSVKPSHVYDMQAEGHLQGGSPPLGGRVVFKSNGWVVAFEGPEVIADFSVPGKFSCQIHPAENIVVARKFVHPFDDDDSEHYLFFDFEGRKLHRIDCDRFQDDRQTPTRSAVGFEEDGSFFMMAPQDTRNSKLLTWPANTPIEQLGNSKHATDTIDFAHCWFEIDAPTLPGWRAFVNGYPEDCLWFTNFRTVDGKFEVGRTIPSGSSDTLTFNPDGSEFLVRTVTDSYEYLIARHSYHEREDTPDPNWAGYTEFDFKRLAVPVSWPYDDPTSEYDRDAPEYGTFYLDSKWSIFRSCLLNRLYLLDTQAMKFVAELEIEGFELGPAKERNRDQSRPVKTFDYGEDEQTLCSDVEQILRCGDFLVARCLAGNRERTVNKIAFVKLQTILEKLENLT